MNNICNKLDGGLFRYMTQYIAGAFLLVGFTLFKQYRTITKKLNKKIMLRDLFVL